MRAVTRRAAAFTQADVHRAFKAAMQAQPGVQFGVALVNGVVCIVPVAAAAPAALEPAPAEPPVELKREPRL